MIKKHKKMFQMILAGAACLVIGFFLWLFISYLHSHDTSLILGNIL